MAPSRKMTDRQKYADLADALRIPCNAWPWRPALAKSFKASDDTILSIYLQEAMAQVKHSMPALRGNISSLAVRYQAGTDILELATSASMQPCIFMRELLKALPLQLQSSPKVITQLLKQPHQILACPSLPAEQLPAHQLLLERLAGDIQTCVDCDCVYSPRCNALRKQKGDQYEAVLNSKLADLGIQFWTEASLREQGYFKTPDALLQVPIAVGGHIVNWIDSKATFGDDCTHREQLREQYEKYINRFGPGMIIYWFGFISDLQELSDELLLADTLPTEVLQLPKMNMSQLGLPTCLPQELVFG